MSIYNKAYKFRIYPNQQQKVLLARTKLKEIGKQIIKIDKWFPSSKTCSNCGAIKQNLLLSDRIYICDCGAILNRDKNAAINIKNEGMKLLGLI